MKKLLAIPFLLLFLSCKVTEKPELIKIDSVKVLEANNKGIKVAADALFLNKNHVGGTLEGRNIEVLIDSVAVATIETTPFNVPRQDQFTMPIIVTIPYDKVFKQNGQNLFSSLLNAISKKKIAISYVGDIRYSLGGFHYDYPLNYKQDLVIK